MENYILSGPVEWDTGRHIWEAQSKLEEQFLLLYSDFVPFPMNKVLKQHERNGLPLTLMASPKTLGNINIDEHGIVQRYDNQRGTDLPFVDIGYMVVEQAKYCHTFPSLIVVFPGLLQMAKNQMGTWIQQDAYTASPIQSAGRR